MTPERWPAMKETMVDARQCMERRAVARALVKIAFDSQAII
jgi:hypothetical protein